jgi:3',5'-cyclic AMP phosphodiesterase CpdA
MRDCLARNEPEPRMTDLPLTRRDALRLGLAASAAALSGADASADAAQATGVVYFDAEGGRAGLANALVSNGRDVAVTDAQGRWRLPAREPCVFFLIKPAGYMVPVDPVTGSPRFYYLHSPQGSPASLDLTYAGVAPTGPLPASIDFVLKPQEEPDAFKVVLFTDPQPESEAEIDYIREDVVESLSGVKAKFGLTAGDLMFDDLSLYDRYNRIIGTLGLPWWNIGGNHDLNFEAPDRKLSRETFKRVFGPSYYAFNYAKTLFLMLDDVDYLGHDPARPRGAGKYEGRLDADQLEFIKQTLAQTPTETLIVIVMHIPIVNVIDPTENYDRLVNAADLFALFEGRKYTVSFAGHTHTTEHIYFDAAQGWKGEGAHHHHILTAVSGSWWSGPLDHRGVAVADQRDGTPNGFHILSVDGLTYKTRFVPAKEPNHRQMRLSIRSRAHGGDKEIYRDFRPGQLLSSPIRQATLGAARLIANVFDGGPKTKVAMHIPGRPSTEMQRQTMPDPFVEELFARNEATKKPWVKAEISSHIWTARLPADLSPGAYLVTVEATTEYGDTVFGRLTLEITG